MEGRMATFEDVYTVPNLAYEISSYLNVDDEMALDRVSKAIHDTNREWVYGMYRNVNIDHMIDEASSVEAAMTYLKKIGPYIRTMAFDGNRREVSMLPVKFFPKLEELEFAVPLILDASHRQIDVSTHRIWGSMRTFLSSLTKTPNNVQRIRIVPGIIKIVETPFTGPPIRSSECFVDDRSPESHLRMYRWFRMPTVLWPHVWEIPILKEFHAPLYLLSYGSRMMIQESKIIVTDWPDRDKSGIMYMASQLFGV
jgi:hypothetical protein